MTGDPYWAAKRAAGRWAADQIRSGMRVGLGSGSTAECFIEALGRRRAEGLSVFCVASSHRSAELARRVGLTLGELPMDEDLDVTVDGADEVAPDWTLIKGLGAALTREKVLAAASHQLVILVDERKVVGRLGERAPLPVEVLPFAFPYVQRRLGLLFPEAHLRLDGERPLQTDNGNWIVDCALPVQIDPAVIDREIGRIPGVVEHGLFVGLARTVAVASRGGALRLLEEPAR